MKNRIFNIGFLLVLAILAVGCAEKHDGFVINGTIVGDLANEVDSVVINRESMKEEPAIYTAPVVNGKFTIKGKVDEIEKINLGNEEANIGTNFILENEEYTVDINRSYFTVKGGKINEEIYGFYNTPEYSEIMKQYREVDEELAKVDMDSEDGRDELHQLNRRIDKIMGKAMKIEDDNFRRIMNDENSSTLAKMFVVTVSQDYNELPEEKRKELLKEYKKELGNHRNLVNFEEYLATQETKEANKQTVGPGNPFKPMEGTDVDGKTIKLGDVVRGNKYTLLEFWASWCSPCRAEIPHLKSAYAKYKDKGLEIYSYSIDSRDKDWRRALKEDAPTWLQTFRGADSEKVLELYGISGIPASFLIDKNGVIVAANEELRGAGLKATLKALF